MFDDQAAAARQRHHRLQAGFNGFVDALGGEQIAGIVLHRRVRAQNRAQALGFAARRRDDARDALVVAAKPRRHGVGRCAQKAGRFSMGRNAHVGGLQLSAFIAARRHRHRHRDGGAQGRRMFDRENARRLGADLDKDRVDPGDTRADAAQVHRTRLHLGIAAMGDLDHRLARQQRVSRLAGRPADENRIRRLARGHA